MWLPYVESVCILLEFSENKSNAILETRLT